MCTEKNMSGTKLNPQLSCTVRDFRNHMIILNSLSSRKWLKFASLSKANVIPPSSTSCSYPFTLCCEVIVFFYGSFGLVLWTTRFWCRRLVELRFVDTWRFIEFADFQKGLFCLQRRHCRKQDLWSYVYTYYLARPFRYTYSSLNDHPRSLW